MTALVSGTHNPIASHAAGIPEAAVSQRGATPRRWMRVWARPIPQPPVPSDDDQLRRFWVAAIGAGAVEDLLRLIVCARAKTAIRRPLFLPVLISTGLVAVHRDVIWVPSCLPLLPRHLVRGLTPGTRLAYRRWCAGLSSDH